MTHIRRCLAYAVVIISSCAGPIPYRPPPGPRNPRLSPSTTAANVSRADVGRNQGSPTNGSVRSFEAVGLDWERDSTTSANSITTASMHCANLDPASGEWRLPSVEELLALHESIGSLPRPIQGEISSFSYYLSGSMGENGPRTVCSGDGVGHTGHTHGTGSIIFDSSEEFGRGVRCVRGHWPNTFQVGNTEWQSQPPPMEYSFKEAEAYCKGLDLNGGGWRLPTATELNSLSEHGRSQDSNPQALGLYDSVWSYTPVNLFETTKQRHLEYGFGWHSTGSKPADEYSRVRCVRGGPSLAPPSTLSVVKLEWTGTPSGLLKYGDALHYCHQLALNGGGWRLPDEIEARLFFEWLDSESRSTGTVSDIYRHTPIDGSYLTSSTNKHGDTITINTKIGTELITTPKQRKSFAGFHTPPLDATKVSMRAWCVRGSWRPYFLAGGMQWTTKPSANDLTQNEAIGYCSRLTISGGGWRLPRVPEMRIFEMNLGSVDTPVSHRGVYWTSDTSRRGSLWYVLRASASAFAHPKSEAHALCVRGSLHSTRNQPKPISRRRASAMPGTLSLRAAGGGRFDTGIYEAKVLGKFRSGSKNNEPYYLVSGRCCVDCDAGTTVFAVSANDVSNDACRGRRFSYPGTTKHYETGQILSESRMFFGDCLPEHANALVSFDRQLGQGDEWRESMTWAKVKSDRLIIGHLTENIPSIGTAEDAVRAGRCKEIPGFDQLSEP